MQKETIVLLPVYQPERSFLPFLAKIRESGFEAVVVNDGSDEKYQPVFQAAEKFAHVLHHDTNRGKGAALKTGLAYIQQNWKEGIVICADADGQHALPDLWALSQAAMQQPETFWIGSRTFSSKIPLPSKLGNLLTRKIYQLSTGVSLSDTQSGLRAFDHSFISRLLVIEGSRYEYEMNQLLLLPKLGINIKEMPIQTIYLNKNKSSHFHRVSDSVRIYSQILKFSSSSFASFLLDFLLYALFLALFSFLSTGRRIFLANVLARTGSGIFNYSLNRFLVFSRENDWKKSLLKYAVLVLLILAGNTVLISVLVQDLSWNPLAAKLCTELLFFFVSYTMQKKWVFSRSGKEMAL